MTPQIENAAVLSDQNVKTYRELSLTRLMTITEEIRQIWVTGHQKKNYPHTKHKTKKKGHAKLS